VSEASIVAGWTVLVGLAGMLALELIALSQELKPPPDPPLFCSPSALHTTAEPPQTQLLRDYGTIRTLLKTGTDQFKYIRRIYEGELHVPVAVLTFSSPLKRADRARLTKPDYQRQPWSGSLRREVERVDRAHGTSIAPMIAQGLEAQDGARAEAGFRLFFAALLDELLESIQQRLEQSAAVDRAIQHARRYYGDGLDAYLSINAPDQAARASFALEAMRLAIQDLAAGKSSARDWFARERGNLMRAVGEGLGT
jgi:hypothetical protein